MTFIGDRCNGGHTISKDGIHFEEVQVALYPGKTNYIFSGSTILDVGNDSGLSKDRPALLAFYTEHNPETGEQQQCLAYSTDYLNFTKYEKNPIISNRKTDKDFKQDFRDPKVILNPILGGYTMVLAVGNDIKFYHSFNLLDWRYTGKTDIKPILGKGICECPDLIRIQDEWFLILSFIPQETRDEDVTDFKQRRTQNYLLGSFDGHSFIAKEGRLLDYGPDFYAGVTFANTKDRTLLMGWGENWDYVDMIPASIRRGKMSSIRVLSTVTIDEKPYLCQKPLGEVEEVSLHSGESYDFEKRVVVTKKEDTDSSLILHLDEKEITVQRRLDGCDSKWLELDGYRIFSAPRIKNGVCHISYLEENGYYEIFADDGMICFSVMTI